MTNIEHDIRNSLYEFYDQISKVGAIDSEEQDHWSLISNEVGAWPRIIYRIAPGIVGQKSAASFSEKIMSGSYPEILIASDDNIREIDPFLRATGFYPFAAWKGMAINTRNVLTSPDLPKTIEVIKPESDSDLERWIEIVTSQLVAPDHVDKPLLESLIAQPQFRAYLLKYNGVGVSTILVFTSENSTGLYLIATEQSAQRQGFASLMVQQILWQEIQKSVNPIILHATAKGEALYSKLGFKPFNQFFLYRFLNTHR